MARTLPTALSVCVTLCAVLVAATAARGVAAASEPDEPCAARATLAGAASVRSGSHAGSKRRHRAAKKASRKRDAGPQKSISHVVYRYKGAHGAMRWGARIERGYFKRLFLQGPRSYNFEVVLNRRPSVVRVYRARLDDKFRVRRWVHINTVRSGRVLVGPSTKHDAPFWSRAPLSTYTKIMVSAGEDRFIFSFVIRVPL